MSPEDLDTLTALVRTRAGLVLRADANYFAETRLGPIARREGALSVSGFIEHLRARPDERLVQAVIEAMAVGETAFFRDRRVFDRLRERLIPALAAARPDRLVRLWCAGCSSGQEAYSLAILGMELRAAIPGLRLDVVGTDLSQSALEKAQAGLYTQFEVQRGLPIRLMLKHFDKVEDMWRASPELRQAVRWRRLNLVEDRRSVRPFDLILCRYVLGDFDLKTRAAVLERFAPALAADGHLLLGLGESPGTPLYQAQDAELGLYRSDPAASRAAA